MQPPPGAITNPINHEEAICKHTLLNARKADKREKGERTRSRLIGFDGLRLQLPDLVCLAEVGIFSFSNQCQSICFQHGHSQLSFGLATLNLQQSYWNINHVNVGEELGGISSPCGGAPPVPPLSPAFCRASSPLPTPLGGQSHAHRGDII